MSRVIGAALAATLLAATPAWAERGEATFTPTRSSLDWSTSWSSSSGYRGKTVVEFNRKLAPGTILISTAERRLYYVLGDGKAIKYGVGVGRDGFTWRGTRRIARKAEWPGWTPPPQMIVRERAKGRILPAYMPGGINNPLGARAMYLSGTLYRIHGTNQPGTIGQAMSSGCIRMLNSEVVDLYDRVKVGTLVIVE
jgi:lipoprotein-anchoring transpeptidase ErfK/SrfK